MPATFYVDDNFATPVPGLDPEKTYRLLFLEHPNMPQLLMTTEAIESFGQLWLTPLLGKTNKLGASVEVAPRTCPPLMPPPARAMLNARGK